MSIWRKLFGGDSRKPLIDYAGIWRNIIEGASDKSWVIFKNGTIVILMHAELDSNTDLQQKAIQLMKEWGPVHEGTPAGDFSVGISKKAEGWYITSHHNDIITFVHPTEIKKHKPEDLIVGMFGRNKRNTDANELCVIHVEDNRKRP